MIRDADDCAKSCQGLALIDATSAGDSALFQNPAATRSALDT